MIYIAVVTPGGDILSGEGATLVMAVSWLNYEAKSWAEIVWTEPAIHLPVGASLEAILVMFPQSILTTSKTAWQGFIDTVQRETNNDGGAGQVDAQGRFVG